MIKAFQIVLNVVPILLMIGLIPLMHDDYVLTGTYALIILLALSFKRNKNDLLILAFGFVSMIVSEYIFVSTGVETFQRTSLLGVMPLWLPFLWAYSFVVIKRSIEILNTK